MLVRLPKETLVALKNKNRATWDVTRLAFAYSGSSQGLQGTSTQPHFSIGTVCHLPLYESHRSSNRRSIIFHSLHLFWAPGGGAEATSGGGGCVYPETGGSRRRRWRHVNHRRGGSVDRGRDVHRRSYIHRPGSKKIPGQETGSEAEKDLRSSRARTHAHTSGWRRERARNTLKTPALQLSGEMSFSYRSPHLI